jgi:hypothetical protein
MGKTLFESGYCHFGMRRFIRFVVVQSHFSMNHQNCASKCGREKNRADKSTVFKNEIPITHPITVLLIYRGAHPDRYMRTEFLPN